MGVLIISLNNRVPVSILSSIKESDNLESALKFTKTIKEIKTISIVKKERMNRYLNERFIPYFPAFGNILIIV
jgi:ribosomal protein S8